MRVGLVLNRDLKADRLELSQSFSCLYLIFMVQSHVTEEVYVRQNYFIS